MNNVLTLYVYSFFNDLNNPDHWLQMPNTGETRAIFNGKSMKDVLTLLFHDQFQIPAKSIQVC